MTIWLFSAMSSASRRAETVSFAGLAPPSTDSDTGWIGSPDAPELSARVSRSLAARLAPSASGRPRMATPSSLLETSMSFEVAS